MAEPLSCQTLILSDLHLGSRHCNIEKLFKLLEKVRPKTIFLNGDIFDSLPKISPSGRLKLPIRHLQFLEKIFGLTKKGIHLHVLPGSHDAFLNVLVPCCLLFDDWDNVLTTSDKFVYEAIDGHAYLIVHGDIFSAPLKQKTGRFVSWLGDCLYNLLLNFNTFSRKFFRKEFSVQVKNYFPAVKSYFASFKSLAVEHIAKHRFFSRSASRISREDRELSGIICGHIHNPEIARVALARGKSKLSVDFFLYMNSGDWVESCTALVEMDDGTWTLIYVD